MSDESRKCRPDCAPPPPPDGKEGSSVVEVAGKHQLIGDEELQSLQAQAGKVTVSGLIGQFGWWQANIAAFYFIAYVLTTFNNLGVSFHAAKTDYHCLQWPEGSSLNESAQPTQLPTEEDQCDQQCLQWSFNNSVNFEQTIISEFGLTCGREWMGSFSQSIYQMGYVLSGILIGYLSDSYGRFRALFVALLFELIGGILLITSNSIYVYTLSRFVLGFGDSGRGMCLYMLILETVGIKYRTDVVLLTSFGWVVGYMLLPLVAYLVMNFRYLQLVPSVIMAVMFIFWLPHIPESPRWLLTKKRFKEARELLRQACRTNGRLKEDFESQFEMLLIEKTVQSNETDRLKQEKDGDDKKSTIWDLLCSRQYRSTTFILWSSFYINGFIYHGFNLNVDILGGNVYQNFMLAGIIEIPSTALNLIGLRYTGRKSFTIATILIAALCYSAIVLLQLWWPVDHWAIVTLSMLGKLFIFSTYNAIYIHAGEIYPTQLRHTGVSSCSIAARAGSTVAPFVKELTHSVGLTVTMIIFGSMSFVTAFLTLFLPETKNKELVDRI